MVSAAQFPKAFDWLGPLLFLLALTGGCSRSNSTLPVDNSLPDTELSAHLAAVEKISGYEYRPPHNYRPLKQQRGATQSVVWQGQQRPDGSTPKFWVIVGKMAPGEEKQTLEETCSILIAAAKQKMRDYSETAGVRSQIGGITFLRLTFQGTETGPTPYRGHGVVYHAHDGQNYIHLMAMDTEPHHRESLRLLEAAMRSFQKP
jgi:hypothetical protein